MSNEITNINKNNILKIKKQKPIKPIKPIKKEESIEDLYINQLSENEKLILELAKSMLKSSFNLKESIGFIEWKKQKEK